MGKGNKTKMALNNTDGAQGGVSPLDSPPLDTPPAQSLKDLLDAPMRERIANKFKEFDKNDDSALQADEIKHLLETMDRAEFERIDTNSNEKIELDELLNFAGQLQESRGRRRLLDFVSDLEFLKENDSSSVDAKQLLSAMSVFVAYLKQFTAELPTSTAHGQWDCDQVKAKWTEEVHLANAMESYQSKHEPREQWMSECGFVLSAMELKLVDGLLEEAKTSLGKSNLAVAHKELYKRDPYPDEQPCMLCGMFGESGQSGCALM